jgi:hypothetical protein
VFVPPANGNLDFTSSVVYNPATLRFEYKYNFTDLANANNVNSLRVTVVESAACISG